MGLFSKEPCAFCGKEVGMMSRTKMSSKDYICDDCRKKLNPFARADHLSKDQTAEMMARMERDEKALEGVKLIDRRLSVGRGQEIHFQSNIAAGLFTITTPQSKRFEHRPVFYFSDIREWNASEAFVNQAVGVSTARELVHDYTTVISLKEKRGADQRNDGWEIRFPYYSGLLPEILIKIPKEADPGEVRDFWKSICAVCGEWERSGTRRARDAHDLHIENAMSTLNDVVKAAVKGEGSEGIAEAVKKGIEKAQDIDAGKVKKKSLFEKLFG